MIRYDRLWKTMEDKELTQYRLIKQHGFSAGQIGRLKKNMHVSTHTIDTLCTILQCGIGDIMEFCPDETSGWTGPLPAQTEEPAADKPKAKKAAKGKTDAVKEACEARQKAKADQFAMYLEDQAIKAQNGRIVVKGDYVIFVIAGDSVRIADGEVDAVYQEIDKAIDDALA